MASPSAIIKEPMMTVVRVPTRSAIRDMRMPPSPEPSHASDVPSAGIERDPPTSAAMSLSPTAVIQAAPNDIASATSAADATAQEVLVSTEAEGGCSMGEAKLECRSVVTDRRRFHHPHRRGPALRAAMRKSASWLDRDILV